MQHWHHYGEKLTWKCGPSSRLIFTTHSFRTAGSFGKEWKEVAVPLRLSWPHNGTQQYAADALFTVSSIFVAVAHMCTLSGQPRYENERHRLRE